MWVNQLLKKTLSKDKLSTLKELELDLEIILIYTVKSNKSAILNTEDYIKTK